MMENMQKPAHQQRVSGKELGRFRKEGAQKVPRSKLGSQQNTAALPKKTRNLFSPASTWKN
jgi:alkylhydroperoxidase/carboxymuconolactone decarboxylase family protein YurZ